MIWGQVCAYIEDGNAVIAWASPNDAGFQFETCGKNRRVPVDLDGLRLVSFGAEAALPSGLTSAEPLRRRGR
jgi:CRISPR-associated protein Cas2